MENESWVSGIALEKALSNARGVQFDSMWKLLVPDLRAGLIKVRFAYAVISDLAVNGLRPTLNPAEERRDWHVPAVAWLSVDRDTLSGGLGVCEGYFKYVELDERHTLDFLDRTESVHVSASGVEFGRVGVIQAFQFDPETVAILDGAAIERPGEPAVSSAVQSHTLLKPGPARDHDRYAEFAAGLAYFANVEGLDRIGKRSAVYRRVADFLTQKGLDPMDEKSFRRMIDLALHWVRSSDPPTK